MSAYTFSRAPQVNTPRSIQSLDHDVKTTIDVDYLYPVFVDEVLPGDTYEFKQKLFARLTTPLTPLMDELYLDTFYFAVPVRLVDKNFKALMGESPVGVPSQDIVAPVINSGESGFDWLSLYDYLEVPPKVPNIDMLAWYPRAYTYIYNDWFRDTNLIEPKPVFGSFEYPPADDVETETPEMYQLLKRCKRLDYFTGALPYPQRGPTVAVPLGVSAPVHGNGDTLGFEAATIDTNKQYQMLTGSTGLSYTTQQINATFGLAVDSDSSKSGLVADLSSATSVTINQLRESIAVQHLYEAFARGGSGRYIEILRSTFGVISPDARMQRSEYLGGTSVPLKVTTVAQTSSSTDNSPLGNLAAFVTCRTDAYWKKSFTEHTIIIGLANVRADLSYSQGLPRRYSRRTRLDFYWPQLANLGEQALLNKEIFAQGTDADDDVFGYQERWAEYRYHPNTITGLFRPAHPQSLDVWHLSQEFESLPLLNQSFIEEAVPIDRVVAVQDEQPLMLWGTCEIKAARPMPLYSIPGMNRM